MKRLVLLSCVGLLQGCTGGPSRPQYEPDPLEKLEMVHQRFITQLHAVASDDRHVQKQSSYIEAGLAYSDFACRFWFDALGKNEQETDFAKNIMNIVGNLIIGIGGINGSSPNSLARGSLLLGAGNATFDSYRGAFLKATVGPIQEKVWEKRKVIKADVVAAKTNLRGFDHARTLLLEYHRSCAPDAIETILRENFEKLEYRSPDTTLSNLLATTELDRLSKQLYSALLGSSGNLGPEDVFKLWVRIIKVNSGEPAVDLYKEVSAGPYTDLLENTFLTKSLAQTVLPPLQRYADVAGFADQLIRKVRDLQIAKKGVEVDAQIGNIVKAENALLDNSIASKISDVSDGATKEALGALMLYVKQPNHLADYPRGLDLFAKVAPMLTAVDSELIKAVKTYGESLDAYRSMISELENLKSKAQTTEIKKPVVQAKPQ